MSSLTNAPGLARAEAPTLSLGRVLALFAGAIVVGAEALMARVELARSRRQLAELDDRLLRDIGVDRAKARFEATKGIWS